MPGILRVEPTLFVMSQICVELTPAVEKIPGIFRHSYDSR